jgi:hypothetical protein
LGSSIVSIVSDVKKAINATAAKLGMNMRRMLRTPKFYVFKSRTPSIYNFNCSALSSNRSWHTLVYLGIGNPLRHLNRAIVNKNHGHKRIGAPIGYQLDEFPYASTAQGGFGAQAEMVPAAENRRQGGDLSKFYRRKLRWLPRPFFVIPVPSC